jgi:TRAP-type C4-dicarboxylate transport system permease small subunit
VRSLEAQATRWTRYLALGAGWVLLGVAGLTVTDALLRKFLSQPLPGTFEASELLLAAVIFFAMPYTGLTDSHVSVDLLTGRLSARAQTLILGVNALVCAVILGFIAYQMGLLAAEYGAPPAPRSPCASRSCPSWCRWRRPPRSPRSASWSRRSPPSPARPTRG